MARIAIVKVRSAHDVEWKLSRTAELVLEFPGLGHLRDRLRANMGQPFMSQLTLPYLAALGQQYNERHGTDHRFFLIDDHSKRIGLEGYDMVWFTAVTPTAREVYRLSDRARMAGATTVIGGIHATMMPQEAAAHADAVVLGEGEGAVFQVLADLDVGQLQPLYNGGRDSCLDNLPLPRWQDAHPADLCPWVVPVQTSRGCRNACRFCSTTRYQGGRRRHRPVKEVIDEIRQLQDRGILTEDKTIFFTDNNIVSDSDHRRGIRDTSYSRALFEALQPLGVQWVGQGEIDVAQDLELTGLLARSGCMALLVGFESVQQQNLTAMGKPCNRVETYAEQITTLHQHGIANIGCFIFGLDHDGPDVFEKTWSFIDRYIDVPQITLLTPFPGTALHRRLKREGRLLHEDWSKYDVTHVVFRPMSMSTQQLEQGYHWLVKRTYSTASILKRALRHATRSVDYLHPRMTRVGQFSLVLAPNLIYRSLSNIGRHDEPCLTTVTAGRKASVPLRSG
jgi:radical SAM superfamily enzyme YgiQ (UPF0313 family)